MTAAFEVDRERTERLTVSIGRLIRQHYLDGSPPTREAVFIALNALAACVNMVLAGAEYSPEATKFFSDALEANIGSNEIPTETIQ